jgi:[ribosomal protein S18]-alanine N-acetyltransferase
MSMLSRLLRRDGDDADRVVVEPMRRRHLTEVMAIEQVSYPKPWTQSTFTSELDAVKRDQRTYLVARRGADLVGYGGLMYVVDDAHVTNIAVARTEQRRGVATRVLAELGWAALERNCQALTLEVRVSNTGAQALYQRFGFVPAGIRQRYYENTDDAIVMWCNDIDTVEYRNRLRELCPEAAR